MAKENRSIPVWVTNSLSKDSLDIVKEFFQKLKKVISSEGDSIWAWYIINILGPERISKQKVNRVVVNPPWVTMNKIQVNSRKEDLEWLAKGNKIGTKDLWDGGKQAPHFDIACLFIHHVRKFYLANDKVNPAAWITQSSSIRGGNWAKFRKWHEDFLTVAIDFTKVKIFKGPQCSLLFEKKMPSFLKEFGANSVIEGISKNNKSFYEVKTWEVAKSSIE